jgi:plasmid maintenance system killer protein
LACKPKGGIVIKGFGNKTASELFHKGQSKELPRIYWQRAVDLLDVMEACESLEDLRHNGFPPSIRLHMLHGPRKGEWAIDIHKTSGWRITFRLANNEFIDVKVENYH